MKHHHAQPRQVFRVARAAAGILLAAALVLLGLYITGLVPDTRLVQMLYMTLLLLGVAASLAAVGALLQLAVQNAFAAGFRTGQASVWPNDQDTQPRGAGEGGSGRDPLLRLVE